MESGAAILSCLESISEILKSPISLDVLSNMFVHIEEIVLWGFQQDNFESLPDTVSIFSSFVRKFENGLPDSVLGYLPIFCFYILGIRDRKSIQTPDWYNESLNKLFIEMDSNGVRILLFSLKFTIFLISNSVLGRRKRKFHLLHASTQEPDRAGWSASFH